MPSWTKDQSLAIYERGGKVIVSAAAGSGKTAVLSERVITYVLDGGNINDLLIVTFTKAAAEEMRGRIKEKIMDALKKEPLNEHLINQSLLVETAEITTMDAFYSSIVKDNFEKLNINRNFNILSNEEESILKDKVVTKVLEDAFINVKDYELLLSFFGAKDTNLIKDVVFKVADFLGTIPFKAKFIKKAINNYENNFYKEMLFEQIKEKMSIYNDLYSEIIEELYNASSAFDKLLEGVNKEKNFINDFLNINNFDELSKRLRSITFDTLRTPKGYKDEPSIIKYKVIRDDFKNEIRKNMSELSFIDDKTYAEEQMLCKNMLVILFEVVNIYLDKLLEEKKKINSFSFSDIAFFVIDLLVIDGKKTQLAKEMSKRYKEILIDEYQDTNNLQNVIFNAISDDNKNLFIVGDVKQSIYRFRSACPEIFNNDKREASKDSFPKLIALKKNFRSRKEVLDFCNFIFSNTMTDAFGEVLYDEDESLYLGASFEEGNNLDTEIHIIDGNKNLIEEKVDDDLSKAQKEAIYVAEKIKSLIDSKYQVYDNKKSIWRDIKESDIVILLRSLKNSEFYVKALNKRGISVYCASSSTYFDNYEIKLIINILKVIDNPVDDVALMSMISSPLFDISLDSVAQIKSKNSLYSDILNGNNEELKDILRKLDELKNYSHNKNIYEVLLKIYDIFNVYPIIRALSGGMQRQKNLVQMINHAFNFEKDDKKSFHEFISYIESITLNKDSLEGINPLSEGDNVLITTIHKSKGLEYPVVFVCETGKSFNFSDVRSSFMINDDLGICFPIRDSLYKIKYETCPIMLFREYEKSKMLSEELRVLYVALTRAKEKIIITGYAPNLERMVSNASAKMGSLDTISNLYLKSSKSYLDIILPCFLRHPSLKDLRDLSNTSVKTFLTESKVKLFVTSDSNINEGEFNEKTQIIKEEFDLRTLNKIKDFVYDDALINVPQSLSVSSFKQKEALIKRPKFMTDNVNHLKKGTLYHKILELLPIKKYTIESLEEELDKMVINNRITKTEKNMINKDKIFSYLKSSVYDIMLNANKVLKEYEMSFLVPANLYDKTLKKGDILVEGVVDLLIEKDGNYIIVDYKTDSVNSKEELKDRYKMQLDLYEVGIKQKMNAKNVEKYIYSIKLNKFIKV